jgi:hypothetical protein
MNYHIANPWIEHEHTPIPSSGYHQAPAHEYSSEYLPAQDAENMQ